MAELLRRIEWNARSAAVIAVALLGTLLACTPAAAQDEEEESSEESSITPMEGCAQRDRDDSTMLERVRRRLTVTACASSAWLDGLFGDQFRYDEYRATYGRVSAGGLWSDYDGFDPRLRFRVRLKLPQWDDRITAFAGRVGEDDYISDTEGDFEALPTRQFGDLEDESVLVGLGYSSPERTGNDFDVGVGVRVDLPLDPYARARYEIVRGFGERYVFTARETVFWQNTEGFGTTTRVYLDRAISDTLLLRWANLGKYTEETLGLEWYTQFTLFQSLNERTGLAWQVQTEGETDNEVQLTRHSARLIVRRQLTPDWLFLELRGGVSWPRRKLSEEREASPEVGIALEMEFGNRPLRREPRPAGLRHSQQEPLLEKSMKSLRTVLLATSLVAVSGFASAADAPSSPMSAKAVTTQAAERDLWLGHIFWVREVARGLAEKNQAAADFAEKQAVANAKGIAGSIEPFYGKAATDAIVQAAGGSLHCDQGARDGDRRR